MEVADPVVGTRKVDQVSNAFRQWEDAHNEWSIKSKDYRDERMKKRNQKNRPFTQEEI